jgi:hypothetical protein
VRRTIPRPKKTDRTAPIAASSLSRVRRVIQSIARSPRPALTADPSISPGRKRPFPVASAMMMNARTEPGQGRMADRVADEGALAQVDEVPTAPALAPRRAAPIPTSAAL